MKRLVSLVLLIGMLAGSLAGCGGSKTITIGMLSNLTSFVGTTSADAVKQYVTELNGKGGINGTKINLVVYDTRNEPGEAVNSTKRLVEKDNALAILGLESSARAIPVATAADELKVPVVATTATNESVTVDPKTQKLHPYMFRVCFIDPYQGYVLADFAKNDLKLTKAAIIYNVDDPYAAGLSKFFEARFAELGGKVVTKEGYQTNEVEFRAQLSNVKAKGAELVLVPTDAYKDAALIGKQAKDLGVNVKFLGADAWVSEDLIKMAGAELQGSFVSSLAAVDAPELKEYNDKYRAAFKVEPTVYAYMSLDAFKLIEAGIKAGATDRTKMRDFLENAKNVPVFTIKGFNMDPKTHNPLKRPVMMLTIKDNKWQFHKTYTPQ